jgi:hypothetical protein
VKSVIQCLPVNLLTDGSEIESDKELNSEISDSHRSVVEHTQVFKDVDEIVLSEFFPKFRRTCFTYLEKCPVKEDSLLLKM